MAANAVIRARIDEDIKNEATLVLEAMGLTVSDALRMMMVKIAKEKSLPFEPLVPNAKTILAMREARDRQLKSFGSTKALMKDLNAKN
jgi:DNA-damage-inducible protein J